MMPLFACGYRETKIGDSMSYRCAICTAKVPPGQPLRRHVVKRPNGQIAAEIPCCLGCANDLASGASLSSLIGYYHEHPLKEQLPPRVERRQAKFVIVVPVQTGKGTTRHEIRKVPANPPLYAKPRQPVKLFGEEV